MASFVASRAESGLKKTDILLIAAEARRDLQSGNKVIDASIGSFLYDNKKLGSVSKIKESLKESITDRLGYPPVKGYEEYKEAVLRWLLKDRYEEVLSSKKVAFGATIGGTGACYIAFNTFLDKGDTVLLPEPMWSNYTQIADKSYVKHDRYELFDLDNNFNIASLKERIEVVKKSSKHLLIVINDPCQNPTGFSMVEKEHEELISLLNEEGKDIAITVLYDLAYLDFLTGGKKRYYLFDMLLDRKLNFLPAFAFSCSKSFGGYGLRNGALFALAEDEFTKKEVETSIESLARGTYSCPPGASLYSVARALLDEEKRESIIEDIAYNSEILHKRGTKLVRLLKESNIPFFRYDSGFFLTLKVDDAFKVYDELKKKHIYIVAIAEKQVRIALSGINEEEIEILVKELKEII